MKHETDKTNARRAFLKTSAAAGAGAAVLATLPAVAGAATDDARTAGAERKVGYQPTRHVLDYYRSARL